MERKSGRKLSKYVLSNIMVFLPYKLALETRIVNKNFNEACLIGFNALYFDFQYQADQLNYLLENNFDGDTQKEHKNLSTQELVINKSLKKFLTDANKGDNLFKNYKEISYLKRPNHLIQKPIMAVLILLEKMPKMKPDMDYLSKEDLDQVWFKCRDKIKGKDFLKQLENFDIRKITQNQLKWIEALFANDPWMTTNWIRRESSFALNLFQWVHKIIEYIEVAQKLKRLGMKEIEIRRDKFIQQKQSVQKIVDSKKLFVSVKKRELTQ